MQEMKLQDLKTKSPTELLSFAEEVAVENASAMRKQELMFAILKQLAARDVEITGTGVVEVLQDGFGFLRSPDSNYLAGPDDIYVSPSQIRRFGLRTGDTVEGQIRSPKEGERYFALLKVNTINFDQPEKVRHRINFDNLTPLYPDERLSLELVDTELTDVIPLKQRLEKKAVAAAGGRRRGDLGRRPDQPPHGPLQAGDHDAEPQGRHHHPDHRPDRAARQRPARPHRRTATHRQDGDAAEHRARRRRQPPGML